MEDYVVKENDNTWAAVARFLLPWPCPSRFPSFRENKFNILRKKRNQNYFKIWVWSWKDWKLKLLLLKRKIQVFPNNDRTNVINPWPRFLKLNECRHLCFVQLMYMQSPNYLGLFSIRHVYYEFNSRFFKDFSELCVLLISMIA